jgi:2-hydroxy-3-oxopropionate reductase
MLNIGYIGLGIMGKSVARNILKAGFNLTVFNRSRAAMDELETEGASIASSPADIAARSDVVFTNLPDSPDVEKVVLGEGGILEGARKPVIIVDNSTIKPATARHISACAEAKGHYFLDAPVSGGDVGAKNGTLSIMVGGNIDALNKVKPILSAIGKSIIHVGESGAGQVAKAANQIMVAAQMVAMGELLVFAKRAGVDPAKVVEAIKGGAAQCWALDKKPQRLLCGEREPGFKAYMQLKDLGIVMDTAAEYNLRLPLTSETTAIFRNMVESGLGELDNSAVVGVLENSSGVAL